MRGFINGLKSLWQDKGLRIVSLFTLTYALFFSIVSILRLRAFAYTDFDMAITQQKCWNMIRGHFDISMLGHTTILGNAFELASLPLSVFYALSGSRPEFLLILQSVALSIGAIPLYLIARERLQSFAAGCIALAYLLYAPLHYMNSYEFSELSLATAAFFFAFYYIAKDRFTPFFWSLFCAMMVRLDMSLVVIMFSAYAFLSRRSWRWVLAPAALGLSWLVIGIFGVLPLFQKGIAYNIYYSHLGDSFPAVIRNLFIHPGIFLGSLFNWANAGFVFEFMTPVLFLPLLALKILVIPLLNLFQHMLSLRHQEHTIHFHYLAAIIPFVFYAAAEALSNIGARFDHLAKWLAAAMVVVAILTNASYGPLHFVKINYAKLFLSDSGRVKETLVSLIPAEASVMSSFAFSPRLANRREYYSFHHAYVGELWPRTPFQVPDGLEYLLVDFKDGRLLSFHTQKAGRNIDKLLQISSLKVEAMIGSVVLFSRAEGGVSLCRGIDADVSAERGLSQPAGLRLRSVQAGTVGHIGALAYLPLKFLWQGKPQNDLVEIRVDLLDHQGAGVVLLDIRPLCMGSYPVERWIGVDAVEELYHLYLPDNFKKGNYRLKTYYRGTSVLSPEFLVDPGN